MRQFLFGEELSIAGRAFSLCEVAGRKRMFHLSICFTTLSNE